MDAGEVIPVYKRSKWNIADLLTKSAAKQDFERLLRMFLGYDVMITAEEAEKRHVPNKKNALQ